MIVILSAVVFELLLLLFGPGKTWLRLFQEGRSFYSIPLPPTLTDYNIEKTTPQFQELWTMTNLFLDAGRNRACNLLAFENHLVLEASSERTNPILIHLFDLTTGELVWQTTDEHEAPTIMAHNRTTVFIGSGIPGEIFAYDVESGNQIWKRSLPILEKSIEYMQATADKLYMNSATGNFYVFDSQSGKSQRWETQSEIITVFHIDNDVIYHREGATRILATDRQTGYVNWQVKLNEEIQTTPLFTEKSIIIKTGSSVVGQVYAIDRELGTVLWQHPSGPVNWEAPSNAVGNIAEDNGYVYYLTLDTQLKVIDEETGQVVGVVYFAPSLQELNGLDLVNREFCVAASDNTVVVYLGSGHQLFAFRFLPER